MGSVWEKSVTGVFWYFGSARSRISRFCIQGTGQRSHVDIFDVRYGCFGPKNFVGVLRLLWCEYCFPSAPPAMSNLSPGDRLQVAVFDTCGKGGPFGAGLAFKEL